MAEPPSAPDLDQLARDILDEIRYVVLGTVDEDGRTRTSPVYFTPYRYEDLYWVSHPVAHHSHNLARDGRVGGVVFDSTCPPGASSAVYVTGTAREVPEHELAEHLPRAFDPEGRGGRRFTAEEVTGHADLRLWVLHVEQWEVHIPAGDPHRGTGRDRRAPVDPRPGPRDATHPFGYPLRMSESQPDPPGRHAAPDEDPTSDPPPVAGNGGDHRAEGPADEGEEDDGDPESGGTRQPGADPEDEQEIEEERDRRLDPENRPENVEVDNTQRDFDAEKGMFTDADGYEQAEEEFPPMGEQGA